MTVWGDEAPAAGASLVCRRANADDPNLKPQAESNHGIISPRSVMPLTRCRTDCLPQQAPQGK